MAGAWKQTASGWSLNTHLFDLDIYHPTGTADKPTYGIEFESENEHINEMCWECDLEEAKKKAIGIALEEVNGSLKAMFFGEDE